ncbi:Transcription factor IIS, N-terminal [Phaffia rhodozyma]|uniref:Transcription factor IIS, N-terminal n=1 Tax=Phaffia rhodozyma TaxID=264483 RepID=A0A0F7SHQ0_PHARH|nr:Transcription factor IIS, N-terminal [Phaffia rhodozyma]
MDPASQSVLALCRPGSDELAWLTEQLRSFPIMPGQTPQAYIRARASVCFPDMVLKVPEPVEAVPIPADLSAQPVGQTPTASAPGLSTVQPAPTSSLPAKVPAAAPKPKPTPNSNSTSTTKSGSSSSARPSSTSSTPRHTVSPPATPLTPAELQARITQLVNNISRSPVPTVREIVALLAPSPPTEAPAAPASLRTEFLQAAATAPVKFFSYWLDEPNAMGLIVSWLKPLLGKEARSWEGTALALLQFLKKLDITVSHLVKYKLGRMLTKMVDNEVLSQRVRDSAKNMVERYQILVDKMQSAANGADEGSNKKRRTSEKSSTPLAGIAKKTNTTTTTITTTAASKTPTSKTSTTPAARTTVVSSTTKPSTTDKAWFQKPGPSAPLTFNKKSASSSSSSSSATKSNASAGSSKQSDVFKQALSLLKQAEPVKQTAPIPSSTVLGKRPISAVEGAPAEVPAGRRRRVTFRPESELVQVKLIERAIYDGEEVMALDTLAEDVHGHRLTELDQSEGSSMKHSIRIYEQVDWFEPPDVELSSEPDSVATYVGQERESQALRELTVLGAMYLNPVDIPPCPSEAEIIVGSTEQTIEIMVPSEYVPTESEDPTTAATTIPLIHPEPSTLAGYTPAEPVSQPFIPPSSSTSNTENSSQPSAPPPLALAGIDFQKLGALAASLQKTQTEQQLQPNNNGFQPGPSQEYPAYPPVPSQDYPAYRPVASGSQPYQSEGSSYRGNEESMYPNSYPNQNSYQHHSQQQKHSGYGLPPPSGIADTMDFGGRGNSRTFQPSESMYPPRGGRGGGRGGSSRSQRLCRYYSTGQQILI